MNDHLGIFDQGPRPDDEDVDVEALRHVLNRETDAPRRPTVATQSPPAGPGNGSRRRSAAVAAGGGTR